MGLPTEIMRFFYRDFSGNASGQTPGTIEQFSKVKPGWYQTLDLQEVFRICARLVHAGYLTECNSNHSHPILGRSYIAPYFDERRATYGEYDFVAYGFPYVREKFYKSVRPVIVTKNNNQEDIGTCFLLGNHSTLVTARHVIENLPRIIIDDEDGRPIRVRSIIVSKDPSLDVGIITTEQPLKNTPFLRCKDGAILDEVLCLGYPPIPGFESMLLADLASINSELKASSGRITASSQSYLNKQRYILLNARVKGGNSGGPIINHQGYVVGILVQTSISALDAEKLDCLGYGIGTPKNEWIKLFPSDQGNLQNGTPLDFTNLPSGGFRTT
ncbi:S1 family peptidase [Nitrospina watsonii]|uniref:S1 family peptidase n=1 Tax=Nitrospina watsonii TaxID=1323948 RepID=UPI002493C3D4|nr:serine protease [Nitrospina watsonii]